MMKIEIFEDSNHEFRWRGIEANGRIVVGSTEGYQTFAGAERAVDNVVGEFRGAVDVVTRTGLVRVRTDSEFQQAVATYPAVNLLTTDEGA